MLTKKLLEPRVQEPPKPQDRLLRVILHLRAASIMILMTIISMAATPLTGCSWIKNNKVKSISLCS